MYRNVIQRVDATDGARHNHQERPDEGGYVLAMVAIVLIPLLVFSAFAVDLGAAYVAQRQARNASDHAALAAAFATCQSADPVAAANDAMVRNGFAATDLTLANSSGEYKARVDTQTEAYFAELIGVEEIDVEGSSFAECNRVTNGEYALFAGGTDCEALGEYSLNIPGSSSDFFGGVHSNSNLNVANNNDFGQSTNPDVDVVTHVGTFSGDPISNQFDPGYPEHVATPLAWPQTFNQAYYKTLSQDGSPGHFFVNGDINGAFIQANGSGLYYATGKVNLDKSVNINVTIVAEGQISISSSGQMLNPYIDNLLAYAASVQTGADKCKKPGIKMAGSNNSWNGYVYAPDSQIEFSGSSNSSLVGSLIGYSIKINGSSVGVINAANPATPDNEIYLTE